MNKTIIFDFDKTLTTRDTLRPFVTSLAERDGDRKKLFQFYLLVIRLRFGLIADKPFKERILKLFIHGKSVHEVGDSVEYFHQAALPELINTNVWEKLTEHINNGDDVYLATANFDFLLAPLAKTLKLAGIFSTQAEISDGYYTGKIIGTTCKGEDKVSKVREALGHQTLSSAVAYGDAEDKALLSSVAVGRIVDNTGKLR